MEDLTKDLTGALTTPEAPVETPQTAAEPEPNAEAAAAEAPAGDLAPFAPEAAPGETGETGETAETAETAERGIPPAGPESHENPESPESQENMKKPRIPAEQFVRDIAALHQLRPDLRTGGEPFPQAVMDSYFAGTDLSLAYLNYEAQQQRAVIADLQQRLDILTQNQEAARRAPIHRGVSGSVLQGQTEDPITRGFDDRDW